jgi:mannose-6-phosphate isomerase-like protein (cupin superfamily)
LTRPPTGTTKETNVSGYSIVTSDEAPDLMAQYPGFGEMRFFTEPSEAEQVALTWRSMPAGTGGKGSYGHRHRDREEIYFVISGNVKFKLGDEIEEVGPRTAVRVAADTYRSVHNDGPDEAELVICSLRSDEDDHEMTPDFWPDDA